VRLSGRRELRTTWQSEHWHDVEKKNSTDREEKLNWNKNLTVCELAAFIADVYLGLQDNFRARALSSTFPTNVPISVTSNCRREQLLGKFKTIELTIGGAEACVVGAKFTFIVGC
jgi:hypothetical protein